MATDICILQVQPGSATVHETATVLESTKDGPDRRLAVGGLVKSRHAYDVSHKQDDQLAEREPNDTALTLKPNLCKSNNVEEPRSSIKHNLSSQTDLFYQVIEVYQKSTKGHQLPPDFDIKKAHNWDEVHQAARLAEAKCKKVGTRSIFSKVGRAIQRSASAVEPWLGLIPEGDYTSVLCGGLKMAFGVAGRIHEQRVQIFDTFQQIPETIRLAEDRLEEWPDDEVLRDAAIELYLAVLKSVEAMILWLVDTSTRRKIGQLLMIPKTGKPKDIGLDDIEKEVKRLQGRATTLQSKAIVRTDANVVKTGSVIEMLNISTQNMERIMTEELRPVMNETHNLVREIRLNMDDCTGGTISIITKEGSTYVNPMWSTAICGERGRYIKWEMERSRKKLMGPMLELTKQMSISTIELWEQDDCPRNRCWEATQALFLIALASAAEALGTTHTIPKYIQLLSYHPDKGLERSL